MYKNILVATDGSPHGKKSVEAAAELAAKLGASVSLVTVIGQGDVPGEMVHMLRIEHMIERESATKHPLEGLSRIPVPAVRSDVKAAHAATIHRKMAEIILDEASRQIRNAGLNNFDTHLENGNPADVILELAEQSGAEMIVMGSRGFGDLKSLIMGSVSHKVLQLAECPCLILK